MRGGLVLLVILAGCTGDGQGDKDTADTDAADAPSCMLTAPAEGTLVGLGDEVELTATVASPGDDALMVTFTSSLDGELGTVDATDGAATLRTSDLSAGTHTIAVTAGDGGCTDSLTLVVGRPPVISLQAPLDGAVVGEGAAVQLVVGVADPDGALEDLQVAFRSDRDGELGKAVPKPDGAVSLAVPSLSRGVHTWTATAIDGQGFEASVSAMLTVDGVPSGLTVAIEPAAPVTGDELKLTVLTPAVDPEGSPITLRVTWKRNGSAFILGDTVRAGVIQQGEVWEASAVASDGTHNAPPVIASVTVGNARPRITALEIVPGTPVSGDTLTAQATVVDPEGDDTTVSYTFRPAGTTGGTPGASATFTGAVRGDVIEVVAVASDAGGAGPERVSDPVTVVNAPPSATGAVITPVGATSADTLTCTVLGFLDPDEDPDQTTYAWSADNGPWLPLGATVPAGTFKGGQWVSCLATPSDGTAYGDPVPSTAVRLGNSRPYVEGGQLSVPTPSKADTVCVVDATFVDLDLDAIQVSYTWTADGRVIGNLSCVTLGSAVRGETLKVVVATRDAGGAGGSTTLETTIVNAPPQITTFALVPAAPITGDGLALDLVVEELDSDTVTRSVSFVVDDQVVQLGTELSWAGPVSRGQVVHVDLVVDDGQGASVSQSTADVEVANAPPDPGTVGIVPDDPEPGEALVCATDVAPTDADTDSLTTTFAWELDGVPWDGTPDTTTEDGDTVPASTTQDGETWTCVARTTDGTDETEARAEVDVLIP